MNFMKQDYILPGYRLVREVGQGAVGTVYEGCDKTNQKKVAVKVQELNDYGYYSEQKCSLDTEEKVYRRLKEQDNIGIAKLIAGTKYIGNRCFLTLELLGPNLKKLLEMCGGKFSLQTVLLLADQGIRNLQYIHSKGVIHYSIKPENLVLGRKGKSKQLYMIDFGRSEIYLDQKTKEHRQCEIRPYRGTPEFASINCLNNLRPSRRDDMEALGYVFFYLLRGSLPWENVDLGECWEQRSNRQRYLVHKAKKATSAKELCSGYPSEFSTYMEYCRSLKYAEEPDYDYLRKLFKDLFERSEFKDSVFDWEDKFKKETSENEQNKNCEKKQELQDKEGEQQKDCTPDSDQSKDRPKENEAGAKGKPDTMLNKDKEQPVADTKNTDKQEKFKQEGTPKAEDSSHTPVEETTQTNITEEVPKPEPTVAEGVSKTEPTEEVRKTEPNEQVPKPEPTKQIPKIETAKETPKAETAKEVPKAEATADEESESNKKDDIGDIKDEQSELVFEIKETKEEKTPKAGECETHKTPDKASKSLTEEPIQTAETKTKNVQEQISQLEITTQNSDEPPSKRLKEL